MARNVHINPLDHTNLSVWYITDRNNQNLFKKMLNNKKIDEIKTKHQELMWRESINIQEKERKRIADDIHDDLLNKLNAVLLFLKINPDKLQLEKLISSSIDTAKRITYDLSPPLIESTSITTLLQDIITPLNEIYTLQVWELNRGTIKNSFLKLNILRIVQELLNNTIKHASATKLEIKVKLSHTFFAFELKDNGVGFDTRKQSTGLGLNSIKSRTKLINGKYKFTSTKKNGTVFFLVVPIN